MLKQKRGKSERAKIVRQLDSLVSKIVKMRDDYTCQWSGNKCMDPRGCHSHHVQSRSNFSLRWDLNNLLTLSYGSHRYVHGHPQQFMEWFEAKFPARARYIADRLKETPRTIRTTELRELLDEMKAKYKQLEAER